MSCILNPVKGSSWCVECKKAFSKQHADISVVGPSESQKIHFTCLLMADNDTRFIYVAPNDLAASKAADDFKLFYGESAILIPPAEYMLYNVDTKSGDAVFQRLKALESIAKGDWRVAVISAAGAVQNMLEPQMFLNSFIKVKTGQRIQTFELAVKLVNSGYERVKVVDGRGQFSVRGDIVDVYGSTMSEPARIEFFDDEVDSVRAFNHVTQRTYASLGEAEIAPAKEIFISSVKMLDQIKSRVEESLDKKIKALEAGGSRDNARKLSRKIKGEIELLFSQRNLPGFDRYLPFIIGDKYSIFDYTGNVPVFFDEPIKIKDTILAINKDHIRICETIQEKSGLLNETFDMIMSFEQLEKRALKSCSKRVQLFTVGMATNSFNIPARTIPSFGGNQQLLAKQLLEWKKDEYKIIILSGNKGKAERMVEILEDQGVSGTFYETMPPDIVTGDIAILEGGLHSGFEYPSCKFVVLCDNAFFKKDGIRKKVKHKGSPINSFTDMKPGDLVVHQVHGIGRFQGLESIKVENITKEYIKILYQDEGFLFVPVNQLDSVQKYIGPDGRNPRLSKLGGSEWNKAKTKVRESLRDFALQLVELYARREALKGHQFSPDTVWQTEFEEGFPFEETDDQLKCVAEIKCDMELNRPMERLLCGDVGYGKTEVALRAAFKAICDGYQVAFLVPTTVLAQQHYNNFTERFKDFPIRVDYICRFRTQSEQKIILKKMKSGEIDILIGTHRLLQKDIDFKKLGLLVIDEEQRFGVVHKEKIKQQLPDIDILTLSATPIPRTLHMSLSGIRDISLLEEPPHDRHPVQTYVTEFDQDMIKNAIYREMGRKGQVFYLYNKVKTIQEKAAQLQLLIPEARIAIGHGQMAERELENVMDAFVKYEFDVLLCTSIIESGLDIPNANTIIVEEGDKLGLSQLYQIRGRVGRSGRLAYAYITYKKDKNLNEVAEKRLQAIKEFTEFGSGFKIAMRDLEIRGAGNVLGAEQHGQLETVGYDMYCKLLGEVVKEVKGELVAEKNDVTADFRINAYIDSSYIEDEESRLDLYQKIARISEEEDVLEINDELIDRYGALPASTDNLIQISYIRHLAEKCDFSSVVQKENQVMFCLKPDKPLATLAYLGDIMSLFKGKLLINAGAVPYLALRTPDLTPDLILKFVKSFLSEIIKAKS